MTAPKIRTAIVVFLVGFALGTAVFAASRLFVRSVLTSDATFTAEELAAKLARDERPDGAGTLSDIVRYSYFDRDGKVIETAAPAGAAVRQDAVSAAGRSAAAQALNGDTVVSRDPLLPSLFGLSPPAVQSIAVPVTDNGRTIGAVYAELDQTEALQSLARAFAVIGMVTVGLAVLAVIIVAFVATRGRGIVPERKAFDPNSLPRDDLTGLVARQGFLPALADAVERAEPNHGVGLMIIDLDGFRTVNDVWGHAVGDAVLTMAAERLRPIAVAPASLARIAGDDFALIVERDATTHAMRQLAGKVRETLGQPYVIGSSSVLLNATVGIAMFPVNAENAEILFRAADSALSKAKAGHGSIAFFDTEMEKRMRRGSALERDLRQALERQEFVIFYQPQLELASGKLRGYEALVRWERPGEGILSPGEFLSVAEDTGLIRPIGQWVLRKACEDAAQWTDGAMVAVNFGAAQFHFQDLDKEVAAVLAETGLPAGRLEIEVPERLFLEGSAEVIDTLTRIKALGVRVAMDDFGAGYSGLSSISHFPFDKIKIDRSFVNQLTEDADVGAMVAAIVALGRSISADVTAEGVETNEQVTLLKAAGCSIVQGFLFGAPRREGAQAVSGDRSASRSS